MVAFEANSVPVAGVGPPGPPGLPALASRLELRVQRPVFQQEDINRTFGYGKQPKEGGGRRWSAAAAKRAVLARVPALGWLSAYDWRGDLPGDLVAGATVAVMHVPQVASAVSFMVGCYMLVMSFFRLGALSNLLSDPLVSGFSAGAAFHAFTSQLKDVLGVKLPRRRGAFNVPLAYYDLALAVPRTNLSALAVSAVALAVLAVNNEVIKPWASKRCSLPIPIELVVVVAASLVGAHTDLFAGLRSIGPIPTGIQVPKLPPLELLPLVALDALTVAVVAYVIAMSLALLFASRERYEVDANQELAALGAASLFGSLFSCIPVTASPSRSSLQLSVGGRTQLASIVSCAGLLVVLLWAGPFFEPMPRCVLASIILVALKPMLVQWGDVVKFWRLSRVDGALWLLTFLVAVLVDLDMALAAGGASSVVILLLQSATPYTCTLQPLPGTDIYVDTRRYANTVALKGVQILQFCGVLNFASQGHLKAAVRRLVPASDSTTLHVVLDVAAVTRIDPSDD
ncbi:solute carrier family 26 member 10-like [Thrips palmi]|uniref:Solute carrier family 26 member 10-like n=1 Tax=Thrips palmi TaxID=161013 RepID=A0A6P8YU17_THRPL|nr:solute carrier family 26 member 10-like [Thrips palmi]